MGGQEADLGELFVVFENVFNAFDEVFEAESLCESISRVSTESGEQARSARKQKRGTRSKTHLQRRDDVLRVHGLLRLLFADLVRFRGDGEDEFCVDMERA